MASASGLAAEVTTMANSIKASDQTLSDAATGANWTGSAADQFRAHAESRSQDFRKAVSLLDDAASALRALAAVVG